MQSIGRHMRMAPSEDLAPDSLSFMRLVQLVLCFVSAWALGTYWQIEPIPLMRAALFGLLTYICVRRSGRQANRGVKLAFVLMSVLLAASMVVGYHLHVESGYSGTIEQNYFTKTSMLDIVAFACMVPGLYLLLRGLYGGITACAERFPGHDLCLERDLPQLGRLAVVSRSLVLFLAWTPYLLAYWPGFVFGDTYLSLAQALLGEPWNNHHPLAYTLFLKVCIKVANLLGFGNNIGLGLSTVLQMGFMALSLAYLITWLDKRGHLPKLVAVGLVLLFGCSPYVASFSIAMWKDPIFTASLVVLTPMLMDFALSCGAVAASSRWWLIRYGAMLLVAIFFRNNGLYVVAFLLLSLMVFWLVSRRKEAKVAGMPATLATTFVILAASAIITGPVYNALGLSATKAESYGVFLNQMARVVVCNGNMTESDKEYMNELLPLNLYREAYTPCCVDNFKWHEKFNDEALDHDFFNHWFSMLVRNPKTYIASWVFETYGFWTINCPEINLASWNISGGVPRNDRPFEADAGMQGALDIWPTNLLKSEAVRDLLPIDEWSVPIGWVFWLLIYLLIVLVAAGKGGYAVALAPSLGLVLTLVIASPLRYWARYGILVQFLVPLYTLLLLGCCLPHSQEKGQEEHVQE